MQVLIFDRGAHPESTVPSLTVVENLEVLENCVCGSPRSGDTEFWDDRPGRREPSWGVHRSIQQSSAAKPWN